MKHYTLTASDRRAVSKLLSKVRSEPPRPAYPNQPWALTKTAESLWALPPCEIGLPGALLRDDGGIDAIGVSCCIFKQNKTNGKLEQMFDNNNLPIRYMVYNHYTISTNQLVQIFQHKDGHWSNERPERIVNVAPPTSTQRPTQGDFTEATCEGDCISFSDGNGNWAWPQGGCQDRPTTTTTSTTTAVPTSTTPAPNRCCINGECFGYPQAYCEARGGAFGDCDALNCTTTLPPCYDTKCYLKCERAYPATPTDLGLFYVEDPDSLIVGESPCTLAQEAVGADPEGCSCYGIGDPCFVEDGLIESLCIGEARGTTTTTPSPSTLVPPGSDLCQIALEFLQGELSPEEFAELTSSGDWYVTRNGSGTWTQCQACSEVDSFLVPNTQLGGGRLIGISVPYGTGAEANIYPALTVHATGCSRNSCQNIGAVADIYEGFAAYGMEIPNGDEITLNGPDTTSIWYYNQWQNCQECEGSSRPAVAPPFYMAHELSQQSGTNVSVVDNNSGYIYYSECVQGIRCDACAIGEIDINGRRIGGPRTQPVATTTPGPDTEGLCCSYFRSSEGDIYPSVFVNNTTFSECGDLETGLTVTEFYPGNPADVSNDDLDDVATQKESLFCLDSYLATTTTTAAPCGCIRPDYCPEPYECSITPCVRGGEIVAGVPTTAVPIGGCCFADISPDANSRQTCYQMTEAECLGYAADGGILGYWLGAGVECTTDCYTAVTTTTTGTTSTSTTTARYPCFPDNSTTTGTSTTSSTTPGPGFCIDDYGTLCDCGTSTTTTTSLPVAGQCPPGTVKQCGDAGCDCICVPIVTLPPSPPPQNCSCGGGAVYICTNATEDTPGTWVRQAGTPSDPSGCGLDCGTGTIGEVEPAAYGCVAPSPAIPCYVCGATTFVSCYQMPTSTLPPTSPRPCACCSTQAPNDCAKLCRYKGNGVGGWDNVFDECPEECPCASASSIGAVSETECDTIRLLCGQQPPPTSTTSTTSTTPAFCCLPDGCIVKYGAPCDGVTEVTAPEPDCDSCFGACCYFDTDAYYCLSTTDQGCTALAGTWTEGASCSGIACGSTPPPTSAPPTTTGAPRGACCYPNGACVQNVTEAGCVGGGIIGIGVWQGVGTDCVSVSCGTTTTTTSTTTTTTSTTSTTTGTTTTTTTTATPQGACCLSNTCSILTEAVCLSLGGVYQGNGTACVVGELNPCVGACCNPATGVCTEGLYPQQCTNLGHDFQGIGTDCDPSPCTTTTTTTSTTTTTGSPELGLCCIGGVCNNAYTLAQCDLEGGTWFAPGLGFTCDDVPCPEF